MQVRDGFHPLQTAGLNAAIRIYMSASRTVSPRDRVGLPRATGL